MGLDMYLTARVYKNSSILQEHLKECDIGYKDEYNIDYIGLYENFNEEIQNIAKFLYGKTYPQALHS